MEHESEMAAVRTAEQWRERQDEHAEHDRGHEAGTAVEQQLRQERGDAGEGDDDEHVAVRMEHGDETAAARAAEQQYENLHGRAET